MDLPIPANREKILKDFTDEKFIIRNAAGSWDITNIGALMVAADLKDFDGLERKAVRVIRYKGKSKLDGIGEKTFPRGYAIGFDEIVQFILTVIPQEEVMEGSIRKQQYSFPENAIRELLANIEIHQALEKLTE